MASHNTDGQRELGISLHPKLPTTRRTTTMKYLSILVVCIMITACSGRINLIAELPKDQDPNDLGWKKITSLINSTESASFSDSIQAKLYG